MERINSFEGIRAYGVFTVVLHHAILMINPSMEQSICNVSIYQISNTYDQFIKLLFMIFNGKAMIAIFFMLSGLFLFRSLLAQAADKSQFISVSFLIKRLFRIFIPLLFSLLLFYGVFLILFFLFPQTYHAIPFSAVIQNSLLYKIGVNGATWTLQAEVIAIFFIILAFYTYIKIGINALLFLTFLSLASLDNPTLQYDFLAINSWIFTFFLGFLCAIFPSKYFKNHLSMIGWKVPLLCLLFMRGFLANYSTSAIFFESFFSCFILIYLDANSENKLSIFLSSKPLQFFGKISFSFYLINVMFLNIFLPFTDFPIVKNHPLEFGLIITVLVYILTTPLAYYAEKFIEQPAIWLGKKLSTKVVSLINFRKSVLDFKGIPT